MNRDFSAFRFYKQYLWCFQESLSRKIVTSSQKCHKTSASTIYSIFGAVLWNYRHVLIFSQRACGDYYIWKQIDVWREFQMAFTVTCKSRTLTAWVHVQIIYLKGFLYVLPKTSSLCRNRWNTVNLEPVLDSFFSHGTKFQNTSRSFSHLHSVKDITFQSASNKHYLYFKWLQTGIQFFNSDLSMNKN